MPPRAWLVTNEECGQAYRSMSGGWDQALGTEGRGSVKITESDSERMRHPRSRTGDDWPSGF